MNLDKEIVGTLTRLRTMGRTEQFAQSGMMVAEYDRLRRRLHGLVGRRADSRSPENSVSYAPAGRATGRPRQ
jgi:hypothetical protein